jgi:hypothetical protein
VQTFVDADALCARIGHRGWARTSSWRAAKRSKTGKWGVRCRKRKLRTDTSGREEWVVASRAQFATEEEATAAITALWIDEEKYKGTAAQLAALEATNCTATSEDDDDGDEQRPTTVSIWNFVEFGEWFSRCRARMIESSKTPSIVRIGDWKRDRDTSKKRNANRHCRWGQATRWTRRTDSRSVRFLSPPSRAARRRALRSKGVARLSTATSWPPVSLSLSRRARGCGRRQAAHDAQRAQTQKGQGVAPRQMRLQAGGRGQRRGEAGGTDGLGRRAQRLVPRARRSVILRWSSHRKHTIM